jgi:cell division protease FtsH
MTDEPNRPPRVPPGLGPLGTGPWGEPPVRGRRQIPEIDPGRPAGPRPNGAWRGWLLPVGLFVAYLAWSYSSASKSAEPSISYTEFFQQVEQGKIEKVEITGQHVRGAFTEKTHVGGRDLQQFVTTLPPFQDEALPPLLREKGVQVTVQTDEPSLALYTILNIVIPFLLIVGFLAWASRRTSKMMGGPFAGMVKGRVKRFEKEAQVNVTFPDVAGLKAAKQDLLEVVDFLKQPERFRRLGGKVPRGILLVGPPGTGKTLLARAVAGEAGVPFFSINGSEFIELFVGVGASRVRELLDEAKKVAPAIIFIDEIDAVGRSRGAGLGGGHDEREQTLNQLLSEMDGFSRSDLTIVLAATNRPDVLDPALLRPGRFDRRVVVDRPELEARLAILGVHTKDKPLGADVDMEAIARNTPGFSGADLSNLCNEAALNATRRGADSIDAHDFSAAYDKIVLGDPREAKLDPEEKRRVAIHEAGHAIVAHHSPHAEPLHRVTIIPRGMALGVTQQTPQGERHVMTRPELEARLRVLMGGYSAESIMLGDTSSGAENDLKQATDLAFKMVAHYGMSDRIGPVYHEHRTEHPFLGQKMATEGGTSDATVHAIEEEARRVLSHAAEEARAMLDERREQLVALRDALLDRETVEKQELAFLLGPSMKPSLRGEADALHYDPVRE